MDSEATIIPWLAAVGAGLLTWLILYKPFFGKEEDFWECVTYIFTPNFISWLQKDLQRDYGKSLKLGGFFLLVYGAGFLTYHIVSACLSH